jgi:queuosine precursor transporter
MSRRAHLLYSMLIGFFIANALIAEFIGVKVFSLERTLGLEPLQIALIGDAKLSLDMTAGAILWPVVFIMTDIINEYFGPKGVQWSSYLASSLILYAFVVAYIAIGLHPADFWRTDPITQLPRNAAFGMVMGQGMWIIVGSIITFLVAQVLDVYAFSVIRKITGSQYVWVRALGSTLISQLLDSFMILYIAFYIGSDWTLTQVFNVGLVNYAYKFIAAIVLTPALYVAHQLIDRYLGHEEAARLIAIAHKEQKDAQ